MSAGLRRYIVVRVLLTVPMVFVLVSLVFLVLRVVPATRLWRSCVRVLPMNSSPASGPRWVWIARCTCSTLISSGMPCEVTWASR